MPYPLNPGKAGKLVVITGPPGSGKSTTAGTLAKTNNWVYYEGDGFLFGFNPYVSVGFEILDGTTKEENAQRIVELIDKECAD